jgi:hypothetical protein
MTLSMTARCAGEGAGSTVWSVVTAGLAAEDAEFVLQGNDVELTGVQSIGRAAVILDPLIAQLDAHGDGIIIGLAVVVHGDDNGV